MERRTMKRKRYEEVKNDLGVELRKLTVNSGDMNNDIQSANEDFAAMCKSMTDRQADFLTRGLFLEEKYGDVMTVLADRGEYGNEDTTGENEVLPTGYADNIQRFVEDSRLSLNMHGEELMKGIEEMEGVFNRFETLSKENLKNMREKAENIARKRAMLSKKLFEFRHTEVSCSDSGSE